MGDVESDGREKDKQDIKHNVSNKKYPNIACVR